jgi:hypothetical protein
MTILKIDEFFQPTKHTWVVAYRHSAKYIGRIIELNYNRVSVGKPLPPHFVRQESSVTLDSVIQLLTPMKQVPLNKQGKIARTQAETVGMVMVPEPIVVPVDFSDLNTPMHFVGTDVQRFFSEMSEPVFERYRNFIENALEDARASEAPGIELATPSDIAAVTRGR